MPILFSGCVFVFLRPAGDGDQGASVRRPGIWLVQERLFIAGSVVAGERA